MSGKDVKAASRAELMKLTPVKDALDQAEAQIVAYRAALERYRRRRRSALGLPPAGGADRGRWHAIGQGGEARLRRLRCVVCGGEMGRIEELRAARKDS